MIFANVWMLFLFGVFARKTLLKLLRKSIAAGIFAFNLLSHEWFPSLLNEYSSGVCVKYTQMWRLRRKPTMINWQANMWQTNQHKNSSNNLLKGTKPWHRDISRFPISASSKRFKMPPATFRGRSAARQWLSNELLALWLANLSDLCGLHFLGIFLVEFLAICIYKVGFPRTGSHLSTFIWLSM